MTMQRPARVPMALAAVSGLVAVAAGAFGAHGVTDPQAKGWLQTGAQYQLAHALAVFACAYVSGQDGKGARLAAVLFLSGGLVFAGTLYAMALGGPRILGAVTPVGGLLLMGGWAVLAWAALGGSRGGAP
jgi:uncharacterized membrane protein YgdD (TMEM256/DUF423 family)